jgi:cyclic pyranopterin phosphate synthase
LSNMKVDYLRVSVTNKCNLRCIYCHPLGDIGPIENTEILSLEELRRLVGLFVRCGVRKVRLTGGEPLLRKDIVELVRDFSSIEGVDDLSLTTNGIFLESLAAGLKSAGLHRVNISIDTMDKNTYEQMTGFNLLPGVIRGIHKAIEVGLSPVKINSVIVKGYNDSPKEIAALAEMSVRLPVTVRFVEYYPTDRKVKSADDYVPNSLVQKYIEQEFGPLDDFTIEKGYGPAVYFKIKNSTGAIGFISGRSSMFCHNCNRLRLTGDGKVKPCLYSARQYDLKELFSNHTGDEVILGKLQEILHEKNRYTKLNSSLEEFSMQSIGG